MRHQMPHNQHKAVTIGMCVVAVALAKKEGILARNQCYTVLLYNMFVQRQNNHMIIYNNYTDIICIRTACNQSKLDNLSVYTLSSKLDSLRPLHIT